MSEINELNAFSDKVNLTMLNDIVEFVVTTVAAPYTVRQKLYIQSPLLISDKNKGGFQEKYGFLYLGELLERYEQRFGMSIQDRRAIALALGYTREITTDNMFVGNQRKDFIQSLVQHANQDIYLAGALYLLSEDVADKENLEKTLLELQCQDTEEIIFVASLFSDFGYAFSIFKPAILHLLGTKRSISTLGNMRCFNWLIDRLQPIIKSMRGKELGLIRALCALPSSFLKEGNKHYAVLVECGYSPLEIAYANMLAVLSQTADKVLCLDSITAKKIVVRLFQEVFAYDNELDAAVYEQLDNVFSRYERFSGRCYGEEKLIDTLRDFRIKSAKTFVWFIKHTHVGNPVFSEFNILEGKWDILATELDEKTYCFFFENNLRAKKDKTSIRNCIDRYNTLTGKDYVQSYYESKNGCEFGLLVQNEVIDLWTAFQNSIDGTGAMTKPKMISNISSYIYGLKTVESFQFCKRFFSEYGVEDYHNYFESSRYSNKFCDGLISDRYSYNNYVSVKLNIKQEYLNGHAEDRKLVLQWLQEYVFNFKVELYIPLVCGVLKDNELANLFPKEVQRKMFDLVIGHSCLREYEIENLKQAYWTEAELTAEKEMKEAAEEQAKKTAIIKLERDVQKKYDEIVDGSMQSVSKFMGNYHYSRMEQTIAFRIASERLPEILANGQSELDSAGIYLFIKICAELMKENVVAFSEIQQYISQIKEVTSHADGEE